MAMRQNNQSETPSNNLWVGNVAVDVADSELKTLFEKYGPVDSVSSYPSRNYAFIYYRRVEHAVAAKNSLQAAPFHGSFLKIEFAKPAKPCKCLWVSGISSSISREELEEMFSVFGKIEDFKFIKDRNTAYVEYARLEDASKALKEMNSKRIGANYIRVDFLRSHSRKESLPDSRDARDGTLTRNMTSSYSDAGQYGPKRQQNIQSHGGQKADVEKPTNVLWISYPPSAYHEECLLHNAMILFGEIERITSDPPHSSFVEFRSVEEAKRAKEGLEGKLFGDPRILIKFSSSLPPGQALSGFHPRLEGSGPSMVYDDSPSRSIQLDVLSHGRSVDLDSFHGRFAPCAVGGPAVPARSLTAPGSFEFPLPGSELAKFHKLPDSNAIKPAGCPTWRRSSPAPGVLVSPSASIKPSARPPLDGIESSQVQRDAKRLRTDGSFPFKEMNNPASGLDDAFRAGSLADDAALVSFRNVQRNKQLSSIDTRFSRGGTGLALSSRPEVDYIWRGIIAKGGTPVCHARCVPVGDWVGYEIPEVVNCSARTGLDMLAKHYADSVSSNVIFFLPDSEEDFASYTEFLRYLGDKNRAGVARFDDGTTLFLVPPSDFLTTVLNVSGPERLYGVFLKFPQHAASTLSLPQPHYIDKQQLPTPNEYAMPVPPVDRVVKVDFNNSILLEDPKRTPGSNLQPLQLGRMVNPASSTPQPGVLLTPELIANLASLLPAKESSVIAQPPGSMILQSLETSDRWEHGHQPHSEQSGGQLQQQVSSSYQAQILSSQHHQAYSSPSSNAANDSNWCKTRSQNEIQHINPISTPDTYQTSHFSAALQYQPEIQPPDTLTSYRIMEQHGVGDSIGQSSSVLMSTAMNPPALASSNHQVPEANNYFYPPQSAASESSNLDFPEQVRKQLQPALYGAGIGQGTSSVVDADKTERYRQTIEFAANLLHQIHQQQPSAQQPGQGAGNL